jgi:hypothetical protein
MRAPFDDVIDLYSSNLSRAVKYDKQNIEFLQNFMIWLIGFSIGALYILASNFLGFKEILTYGVLKSILIMLSMSITFGVSSRVALFFYQSVYNGNLFYIEGALSNKEMMTNEPEDVSKEDRVEILIDLLRFDFGIDESPVLPVYNAASKEDKLIIIEALRKRYTDMGVYALKSYNVAFNHINAVMKTGLGFTNSELKSMADTSGKKIRVLRNMSFGFLFLSCSSFIMSLTILSIAY